MAVDGRLQRSKLSEFFDQAGMHPTQREIDAAFNAAVRGCIDLFLLVNFYLILYLYFFLPITESEVFRIGLLRHVTSGTVFIWATYRKPYCGSYGHVSDVAT